MKKLFDKLEHGLRSAFTLGTSGVASREPIEIRRAIVREIADQVQPKGGGEYFFPFTEVSVAILARDSAEQQLFEASFDAAHFAGEVRAQIADRDCRADDLVVTLAVVQEQASEVPYRIRYEKRTKALPVALPRPPARLIVLQGNADVQELEIDRDFVYIGRLKEVMYASGGLERRNQLAFDATETTVSRRHALIKYDSAEGKFRAFNDPTSSLGTRILREGRPPLECDATRGVQLRSGDELVLGEVRIRFEIAQASGVDTETRP